MPLFGKSLPFDPGQPQRNAAPADILQARRRLPNWLLAWERAQLGHGQAELGRGQTVAHTGGLLNDRG